MARKGYGGEDAHRHSYDGGGATRKLIDGMDMSAVVAGFIQCDICALNVNTTCVLIGCRDA